MARRRLFVFFLSVLLLFMQSLIMSAAQWIDVTSAFVKNPSFDGNSYSNWDGTALSGNGAVNNAEHYYKYYDTYQTISGLQAGKYRVSLQAFYRMGNSSNDYDLYTSGEYADYQYAKLYANSTVGYYQVPIAAASSAALKESLGGAVSSVGGNLFIPNNMTAANAWFEAGHYMNTLEFEVGEDGTLTIGIYKYDVIREDWTCLDNWKLEYYEEQEVVRITDLSIDKSIQAVAKGRTITLAPAILPATATNKVLKWTSSNEEIATVDADGVVTGVSGGKAIITAATTDMSGLSVSVNITVFNILTSDKSWVDITDDYIVNPRYDGNDWATGWSGTQLSGSNPKENAEHYDKLFDTYQEISGLPTGTYRLNLNAFYRIGSSSNDYNLYLSGNYADQQNAKLYAVSATDTYTTSIVPLTSGLSQYYFGGGIAYFYNEEEDVYYYVPNNMEAADAWFNAGYYRNSLECKVGYDGKLTIGIKKDAGISEDWTCIDNWTLEYYGAVKLVTGLALSSTSAQLVNSETLQLTAAITPANAIYRKLVWTSSDESVVSVDANGFVTAVGTGAATVTAATTDGSELSASCDITVVSNDVDSDNIVINEIMAHNVDVYLDPSFNYGSWVELYNPSNTTISLGGLYVTDDPGNLRKHRLVEDYGVLAAKGFAILNFDHHEVWTKASYRQIDDKLSAKGGTVIISDGTNILAQQSYPEPISRVSYARTADGGSTWGTTGNPTPGESNATSTFATVQLPAPVVDTPAKLFGSPFTVRVTIPDGATLRYTTDGTAPTLTNGATSSNGVFSVDATICYRFRLFKDGFLPSTVVTRSYIEDSDNEPFPIISIVTDSKNIYGTYGVFSQSANGRPGNGQTSACNWNMDWDRPVNFEYITTDGECVVSQECDFATCGGWSRAWTPHAFKLKAKKLYDLQNTFEYQFFDNKPFLKHKTLQIRNGGNDTSARIKDAAIQGIIEESGIYADYQSWKPVHVFINGSSYAVLNMREPNNKDFAYSNYGYDTDLIDQFEISPDSGYVQMRGTEDSFLRWYDLSANAADESTYKEISNLVDIDNYVNYMALEFYMGNWDWPQNNVKGFRSQEDGKFHFVLFDLDGALSTNTPLSVFFGKQNYQFDTLHGYDYSKNQSIEGRHNNLEIKFVTIFRNMLQNAEFYKKFIDAYCLVAGSVFTPELTQEVTYERAGLLAQGNYVNPWGTASQIVSGFSSRQANLINHLQNYFWIDSSLRFNASLSSNIDEGRIMLNDQPVPTGKFSGPLFLPVTLRAEAPAGYRFAGWGVVGSTASTSIFSMGATWKYYDKGSLDNASWRSSNYSDNSWPSGSTPIGYDYNNQHPEIETETEGYLPTYYLRKSITLDNVSADDTYLLDWIADDGFVVYVNGTEAGRYNMPAGTTAYNTYATSYAHNNPDNGTMTLDASLFKKGSNVIAVELHNNASNSTDILWNAALRVQNASQGMEIISADPVYVVEDNSDIQLQAIWEPLPDEHLLAAASTPVKINEVSASNSVYLNEYFKKNDWIELYNTTDNDIDVAGMYISDNLNKPQKYQIAAASEVMATYSTIIPAHGYMVIWADQLLSDSQIHTGFKLGNADDEVVMLTAADGAWSDTLSYKMHDGAQSVGLYPDGGSQAYVMDVPTIGKSNILTSYATLFEQFRPEPQPDAVKDVKSDGELQIAYSSSVLNIIAASPMRVSVDVFNAAGQRVLSTSANVYGSTSVSCESLSSGVYVAKVSSSDDNHCQLKFVRR